MTIRKVYIDTIRTLLILGLVLGFESTVIAADFVVIANKGVPVNSLSKAEIQAIFLGEKVKWDYKHRIKIAIPEQGDLLKDFLTTVVGKTPSQFDTHWSKLAFTGRAMLPPSFSDMAKLVEFIASQQGAVSFVPAGQQVNSVNIISIK